MADERNESPRPTWDGAYNLSDLGGIPTSDGVTQRGRVFRSGAPEFLTDLGWAAARAAGVTDIVDLRNERERSRRDYHPAVSAHAADGIQVHSTPTEDETDAEFLRVCGPWLDHPRSYADNLRMYPEKFADVFRAIASAEGGVVIHCAGGRDRTGMISAMLLRLAGATPQAIANDYERGFRGARDHIARVPDSRETAISANELDARIADRVPVLATWIDSFDVGAYLEAAGLDSQKILSVTCILR